MQNSKKTVLLLVLFGLAALMLGFWASHHRATTAHSINNSIDQLSGGTLLQQPRTPSPFKLTDGKDQAFTEKNLEGKWTFLFFGFTHCPMICPTAMATLNQVYLKLTLDKTQLPQVVFISVDPERDTPKLTGQYASGFNPHFIGATGSAEQLAKLTKELGVVYFKVVQKSDNPKEPDTYGIDHSSTILLFNPKGQLVALFSMPHDPEKVSADYLKLITKSAN